MFKYACPEARPAASAASAPAGVPPFAVMNAGFHVVAASVLNVMLYEPLVTPSGKPVNVGVVVATPTLPGGAMQQWICDAVVPEVNAENVAMICNVCAAVSMITVVEPVPLDAVGGFSFAALRFAV